MESLRWWHKKLLNSHPPTDKTNLKTGWKSPQQRVKGTEIWTRQEKNHTPAMAIHNKDVTQRCGSFP